MNGENLFTTALVGAAMAGAGLGFGLLYFRLMRLTVASLVAKGGWLRSVALTAVRVIAAIAVFAVAAKLGAIPLLAAFGGMLVARRVSLRSVRGAA